MAFVPGTLIFICDKSLGPAFYTAVAATGLIDPHFSVMTPGPNGAPAQIEFFEDTPQETIDAIIAVYEAYDPAAELVAELAASARTQRDAILRSIYDPGILMAQRALRMASSPTETSYAEGKIAELDEYAQALQEVPEQPSFPQTINWPIAPTK